MLTKSIIGNRYELTIKKYHKNILLFNKKWVILHLFYGTSCKVAENDAVSNDMRTEMAAIDILRINKINN